MQLAHAALGTEAEDRSRRDFTPDPNRLSLNSLHHDHLQTFRPKAGGTSPDRELATGVAPHRRSGDLAEARRRARKPDSITMNTSIPLFCRVALALVAPSFLTQCAYEPVTRANAAQASRGDISSDARAALQDL